MIKYHVNKYKAHNENHIRLLYFPQIEKTPTMQIVQCTFTYCGYLSALKLSMFAIRISTSQAVLSLSNNTFFKLYQTLALLLCLTLTFELFS